VATPLPKATSSGATTTVRAYEENGTILLVGAVRQHQREGGHAEADDDGGQHERLHHRVGGRRPLLRGEHRHQSTGALLDAAHRDEVDVGSLRDHGDAPDDVHHAVSEQEEGAEREQDADGGRDREAHSAPTTERMANSPPTTTQ
jgi:hypothetical protein